MKRKPFTVIMLNINSVIFGSTSIKIKKIMYSKISRKPEFT